MSDTSTRMNVTQTENELVIIWRDPGTVTNKSQYGRKSEDNQNVKHDAVVNGLRSVIAQFKYAFCNSIGWITVLWLAMV